MLNNLYMFIISIRITLFLTFRFDAIMLGTTKSSAWTGGMLIDYLHLHEKRLACKKTTPPPPSLSYLMTRCYLCPVSISYILPIQDLMKNGTQCELHVNDTVRL